MNRNRLRILLTKLFSFKIMMFCFATQNPISPKTPYTISRLGIDSDLFTNRLFSQHFSPAPREALTKSQRLPRQRLQACPRIPCSANRMRAWICESHGGFTDFNHKECINLGNDRDCWFLQRGFKAMAAASVTSVSGSG